MKIPSFRTAQRRITWVALAALTLTACASNPREPFYLVDTSQYSAVPDYLADFTSGKRTICKNGSTENAPTTIPSKVLVVSRLGIEDGDILDYLDNEHFTINPSNAKSIMFLMSFGSPEKIYTYVKKGATGTGTTVKHSRLGVYFCFVDIERGMYFTHRTGGGGLPKEVDRAALGSYLSTDFRVLTKSFIDNEITIRE